MELDKKQIKRFKKANKTYKETLAKRWGFTVEEIQKEYYERKPRVIQIGIKDNVINQNPTIRNIHILDKSYSMKGSKFNNALQGINSEIEKLKTINPEILQTVVAFDRSGEQEWIVTDVPVKDTNGVGTTPNGATALYETIGVVLERFSKDCENKKTLVKIFTDGSDNHSKGKYSNPKTLLKLIKNCENRGFTITFVGTKNDVRTIEKELGIDKSNTLTHDNTGKGIKEAFEATIKATTIYTEKVAKGEDTSKGFYSGKGNVNF